MDDVTSSKTYCGDYSMDYTFLDKGKDEMGLGGLINND